MAKEEKVVEQAVEEINPQVEETVEGDLVPEVTVKEDGTHKIDFDKLVAKPIKGEVAKQDVKEEKVEEAVAEEPVNEEPVVLEEVTQEVVQEKVEELEEQIEQAVVEEAVGIDLPDNIKKVVDFVNETGGSLEDYVKLNQDVDALNEEQLLVEYYQNTRPHLDPSEINFLIEDKFAIEEDMEDERDIKRKKLARKEELANAKNHLNGLKTKYYEEIKAGSRLAPEQQKAVDFFNRYNEELEETNKTQGLQQRVFQEKTSQVFNDQFKGFEYKVGEKKYRFNVKDAAKVKDTQSDINNFVKKFLNEKNEMSDASGYHKSLFTAMNPDLVAQHFYEQGKADAVKNSMAKSKNIDMDPRSTHGKAPNPNGFTVKAVDSDSNDFKFKIKTR